MTRLVVVIAVACACKSGRELSEAEQMQSLPVATPVDGKRVTLPKAVPRVGDVVVCEHSTETRGLGELSGRTSRFTIRERTTREWTVLRVRASDVTRVRVAYPDEQRSNDVGGRAVPEPILLRGHAYVVDVHDDGTLAIARAEQGSAGGALSPEETERVRGDVASELTGKDPNAALVGVELVSGRVVSIAADAVEAQVGGGAKVHRAEARLIDVPGATAVIESHTEGEIAGSELPFESRALSTWDTATGRVLETTGVLVAHGPGEGGVVLTNRGQWIQTCHDR
jgi:hypothetical protein